MQTLKETATCIAQFGVTIDKPILTLILLAEVNKVEKQEWGHKFCLALSNIKKQFKYDYVHNTKLILKEPAAADSAWTMKDAAALGVTKAVGNFGQSYATTGRPAMQTATTTTNYP